MRAVVKVIYRDKHTNTTHLVGTEVTLTTERFAELNAKGYVTKAPQKARAKKENKPAQERTTKEEKSTLNTK